MKEAWISYLQTVGAQCEDNFIIHFGQPELERQYALQSDIITDLSYLGLIQVSGDDAEKFLQGQFTHDVRQVTTEQSQLSAWCSPKGRILVNFRLFKREEAYYLLLPRVSVETILKRLQMYVLRAQVKLKEVSDHLFCLGVAGPHSTQILTDCLGYVPSTSINSCVTVNQITTLSIPGIQPRYLIITETAQNFWECATQSAHSVGTAMWQLLDILAGLPQIVPATSDEFVPQMVNYHIIDGVSFNKGCYTGQEIVARLQYLGSLKRRMYLAKINSTALPQPGDLLYISTSEQSVGKIVNAQVHPDGGTVVLAVIQIKYAETKDIHWQSIQGECLQIIKLPYPLDDDDE